LQFLLQEVQLLYEGAAILLQEVSSDYARLTFHFANRSLQGTSLALSCIVRLAHIAALALCLSVSAFAQDTTILAYHEVDPVPERGWAVSSEDFAGQMRYLALAGYNVIPLSELVDYIAGRRDSLAPNAVIITVDDGWVCASTEMQPVLKRFSFPWSLYVYPKIVGQGSHALTWAQIAALQNAGVDVEGHTMSHAHLMHKSHPELTDEQYDAFLRTELDESKRVIASHTGQPVRFLAYPYGDYDDTVVAAAKRAGYEAGLLSWFGANNRYTDAMKLRRFAMVSDTSLEQLRTALGAATLDLHDLSPAAEGVLDPDQTTLTATIDDSQLDPTSIRASFLGDTAADSSYDAESHRLTLTWKDKPREQRQTVIVIAATKTGGRAIGITRFYTSGAAKKKYDALKETLAKIPLHHADTTRQ
jgi:peptidoglycan/xylan/chitin deacetylase (PgdA/CDA1 family)